MVEPALFGPIDTVLAPVIQWVILVLVLVNLGTRALAHRSHRRQASDGDTAISRHPIHQITNVLLVVASFYLMTVEYNAGIVLSTLVLGMVIADFFEIEARRVEARTDRPIELPKGSLFASVLVVSYAAYLTLFFLIEPIWNAII